MNNYLPADSVDQIQALIDEIENANIFQVTLHNDFGEDFIAYAEYDFNLVREIKNTFLAHLYDKLTVARAQEAF